MSCFGALLFSHIPQVPGATSHLITGACHSAHMFQCFFFAVVYIITVSMSKNIFAESTLDLVPLLQPL